MSDLSPQSVVDKLDAISKTRALTNAESLTLEKAIRSLDNILESKFTKRDAARGGIKRNMGVYARPRSKTRSDHKITRKIEAAECAAAVLKAAGHDFEAEQVKVLCRAARSLHTTASLQRKDIDELRACVRNAP